MDPTSMDEAKALLEAVDSLIAKARAARELPILSAERNATLLPQHGELLRTLQTLRAFIDGHMTITSALFERVNVLASLYSESQPGKGDWMIRPMASQKFRPALFSLLNLARDLEAHT